jgi:hypothetical protein
MIRRTIKKPVCKTRTRFIFAVAAAAVAAAMRLPFAAPFAVRAYDDVCSASDCACDLCSLPTCFSAFPFFTTQNTLPQHNSPDRPNVSSQQSHDPATLARSWPSGSKTLQPRPKCIPTSHLLPSTAQPLKHTSLTTHNNAEQKTRLKPFQSEALWPWHTRHQSARTFLEKKKNRVSIFAI